MGVPLRDAVQATALRTRRTFCMTPTLLDVVDGLMLGDAWLEVNANSEGRLCLEQIPERGDWLDMVESIFDSEGVTCSRQHRPPRQARIKGREFISKGSIVLRTGKYQPFTEQRSRWYVEGKKRVPLDVRLTPQSLAHWFWGDGCTGNNGYRMVFHTDGFNESDVDLLQGKLRSTFGWEATKQERRKGVFTLALSESEFRRDLVGQIRPYCPPCFAYKLNIKE